MRNLATKEHILQDAGYSYNFDRELYLNRKAKKAFSVKFVEDRSEEEIQSCIREDTDGDKEWHFFFVDPPSDMVNDNSQASWVNGRANDRGPATPTVF